MSKNLVQFAQEVKTETKRVTWPSRKEVTTTTTVVFIMVAIMAMVLLAADFVISHVVDFILNIGHVAN